MPRFTVLPVLDRRVFWLVVDEVGDWAIERHRLTGHLRLVNQRTKLRYASSFDIGVIDEELRKRLAGDTSGGTLPNVAVKTLGGGPFWIDRTVDAASGWRIQQNRITKHLRLLDAGNRRRAWGFDVNALRAAMRDILRPVDDAPQALSGEMRAVGRDDPAVVERLAKELQRLGI